jgi:hypothetical protein
MKRSIGKIFRILGIVVGAVVALAAAAALLVLFDKPLVRNIVRRQLGPAARFARLDYSLFPFRVLVEGLELDQENAYQKVELSVPRLEAKGSLGKLVRGVKPALDSVEVEGASFRLTQKAVSEEPFDAEALLLQASDTLAWARRISLTGARLSIELLARLARLENLDLTVEPGRMGDTVGYSIGRADLRVREKAGDFAFASGLSSKGSLRLISPFGVDAAFDLRAPRVSAGGFESSLDALAITLAGRHDGSSSEFAVSRLTIGAPGLVDLEGTAAGRFGHSVFIEARARARLESLERAASLLGPRLPAALRDAGLRGRAELSGTVGFHRASQGSSDRLDATLALQGVEFDAALDGRPVHVKADGRIDASGPFRDPRLSADLRSSVGRISLSGFSVAGSEVRIAASGTRAAVDVAALDARLSGFAYAAAEGRTVSFDKVTLAAKGTLDLAGGSVEMTSLEARLPGLAPLRLSGRLGFGKRAPARLRLESRGLDVAALRTAASPFVPAGLAGWDLAGTADLSLDYRTGSRAGEWGVKGTASFSGIAFNDPSFTIAGEGLDPNLRLEAAFSPAKGLSFTSSLGIPKGESLWKAVYVSWSKHPLELAIGGRYDPGAHAFDGLTVRAGLPGIGTVDAAGSGSLRPALSFDLRAGADLALGPLYSLTAQAGASEEGRMTLEGKVTADLRLRKDGAAFSAAGRVRIDGGGLERPQAKTLLAGVSADLPLRYESAGSPAAEPDAPLAEEGRLRIGALSTRFLSLESVDLPLRAGVNALGLEPVSLELFGGRLDLGRTTFRYDPADASFQGLGSLTLRDIDIARFPIASPQLKLTGKVQADFPRLDIGTHLVAVSGRGEAAVFGGKIVLRDLAVSEPFAPGRSISLNVDLVDLDMKKLTDEVPFGEVTGIVRGEIRNLVLTYNQPERFEFRLESVPRKGVAQTFSLKAVDNLTVLSSGQSASAGTGGFFMRFVRGFRYEKLGIVSTLRNDTFTLNGTIHEGGLEYLVKKPALFGISVVNREPEKRISFKEMTSRLKRVGQSEK